MNLIPRFLIRHFCLAALSLAVSPYCHAQGQVAPQVPVFAPGVLKRVEELPQSRFRQQLENLAPPAKARALEWLQGLHLPAQDVQMMQVDANGGICYGCKFGHNHKHEATEAPVIEESEPQVAQAPVAISPFPDSLKFHSRPGSTKKLYINFVGQTVSGTAWNNSLGRASIVALPFDTDNTPSSFSDAEQLAIKRIWQRMAEDYAPFDIDVTTEAPAVINSSTAICLITRNTDASGNPNPAVDAGGVAYVNVFGRSDFISTYSPAWVYHNNLGNTESYIAEAASHEIGHNLGLTHDATTTTDYYGGHFTGNTYSDQTSWGPLMGTGYDRNVSQWSKGEYLNANNTQDDLSVIAGKLNYRPDDHGNTAGTARPLVISGTVITSTTPENDPANNTTANKGVIERNTDVDVFSFTSGTGAITLNCNAWIQSGTRGGNLDVLLELYNQAGTLIASNNATTATSATISTSVTQGVYYLHVKNSSVGNPTISPPTGYTSYGSIGQYFLSGTVVDPGIFVVAPVAEPALTNLTSTGQSTHQFSVTYSDNVAINVATLGTGDVRVTGPSGYDQIATFVSVNNATNGTPRIATYSITPVGGGNWLASHNGTYTVAVVANQVQDTEDAFVAEGTLGTFDVAISTAIYVANMSSSPGWTLDSPWSYGQPSYNSIGLTAGFTGTNVIGHSMSSNYAKPLALSYATTPLITNAAQATSLTLSFRRWLGLKKDDTAIVQVTGDNGSTWMTLWSTTAAVNDGGWQPVQYALPQSLLGSAQIKFRWGLSSVSSSGNSPTAIGWHIDDVELLTGGAVDAGPPAASLSAANITSAGSPTHSCTVTYTDATAVLRSSVEVTDLVVIGPAGPASPLTIDSVGVDLVGDGSPLGATYSIIAPGGTWDISDNGTYTITLQDAAVADTMGNVTPLVTLGTFNVAITTPGVLSVTPTNNLVSSGPVGGSFSPASQKYTLTNTGQTSINWSATKSASWVTLLGIGGLLGPGASATVTVSFHASASNLSTGTYNDTINFTNTTNNNGSTTRSVNLTVTPLGTLTVTPAGNFSSSGTYGGSFSPTSQQYTVQNTGTTTVNWTATRTAEWLTLTGNSGSLAAGASTTVTATIHANANTLNAATYNDTITFTNTTNSNGNTTRSVALTVNKASQVISFGALSPVVADQPPFPLSASSTSGLPVSYDSSNTNVATISGNTVTLIGAGTTIITASQAGDTNYLAATSVPQTLTVKSPYLAWTESSFANPLDISNVDDDQDGDGSTNFLEFAFGTDPTAGASGIISYVLGESVTNPGNPVVKNLATLEAPDYRAVFGRRKNYLAARLTYTVQFSADMQTWTSSSSVPTVLTGPGNSADVDAVSVPFPELVPAEGGDRKPTFFRITVAMP